MKRLEPLLRYVFWAAVSALVGWLAKKAFESTERGSRKKSRVAGGGADLSRARKLLRDPVCGTYIAENIAYSLMQEGENLHFCSRDCMERYERGLCAGKMQLGEAREAGSTAGGA